MVPTQKRVLSSITQARKALKISKVETQRASKHGLEDQRA